MTEQIDIPQSLASAEGLTFDESLLVSKLTSTWLEHVASNQRNESFYEGTYPIEPLGIAIDPKNASLFEERVDWARKAVDYIASRSQFDGFSAGEDQDTVSWLRRWSADNDIANAYAGAITSTLTHSCAFATVTDQEEQHYPLLRFYPATAAAALWDRKAGRLGAGLVVADMAEVSEQMVPTLIDVFTPTELIELSYRQSGWEAKTTTHSLGRCHMVAIANRPSLRYPFGRSKIGPGMRSLVGEASEVMALMKLAVQFAAAPQTYALGLDPETMKSKSPFKSYLDRMWAVSRDENGDVPQFGQLTQLTMEPLLSTMRTLSSMAAADAGVPSSTFGVVTDNPSSAEAINAAREDAVIEVTRLNRQASSALADAAHIALAIRDDITFDEALEAYPEVAVKFRPASMPSEASLADSMLKQSQIIEWLADSDVLLKRLGYTDEEIASLEQTKRDYRSRQTVESLSALPEVAQVPSLGVAEEVGVHEDEPPEPAGL